MLNDEQIDIAMRAADVAIWTREPQQTDLIRRPLFTSSVRAFASTQYIRRFGAPQTLDELDGHPHHLLQRHAGRSICTAITLAGDGRAQRQGRRASRRSAPTASSRMKYAIRAGIGIGLIPDYMTDNEADLVPVLTEIDAADAARSFRLPGGAQDRQEGAGVARFSRRQGPPVEVLN